MLHCPACLGLSALKHQNAAHSPLDGFQHPFFGEYLIAVQQEFDVPGVDSVVDGDERRVVGLAFVHEIVPEGPSLRPTSDGILALDHKVHGLVYCGPQARVPILGVEPQQEGGGIDGAVVKGGVAAVVKVLLGAVAVSCGDLRVPVLQRAFSGEVCHIVPASAGKLGPNQS